ncbi:PAS domain-containing sensor histidine kinase [Natronolimnobius baerhuensis]|uniref:histidine kinase n=1 Tax=Natronolimnobius baerhuensis TaxID=253108 RepID=A0A202E7F1_9EURY|nr:PAS domain-containing sensor histidine kinase [Natronolimnobius baerhuensis]OVE84169.1 PAS domain-containing sensor histidine kinase [Natronolimnobius baerhuensis]
MGNRGHTSDEGDAVPPDATPGGYHHLFDVLDERIAQFDATGCLVSVNESFLELLGTSRDAAVGTHLSAIFARKDGDRLENALASLLEGDTAERTLEVTMRTADGGHIVCHLALCVVHDSAGDARVAMVIRDTEPADQEPTHSRSTPPVESLQSVIDEADVGVFVLDESFDVVWIDKSIETYFGVNRDDVIGRDKRTLIQNTIASRLEDPATFTETVFATYDSNTGPEQFECHVRPGPDREDRWIEHRSKPIKSGPYDGGRIELYYDVTSRKQAENARVESEKQFRSLVDAVEEYAIFRLDPDGHVVSWNAGATRIKGYEPREILGKHFSLFYTAADRDEHVPQANLERARENGVAKDEGWRCRSDGSRFWASVTITAIRDADGTLEGFAKVTRDMTDRREREQRLQRERDLVERILQTSPVGIAVINPDGTTNQANERMAELLSVPVDDEPTLDPTQRKLYDSTGSVIPIEERPARRVFETGEPVTDREVRVTEPDGRTRWLSITATPLTDESGAPDQVVMTATDITDLKTMAEQHKRKLEEREKEYTAVQLTTSLLEPGDKPTDKLLDELVQTLPQAFRFPEKTEARLTMGDAEATTDGYLAVDPSIGAQTATANGTPITVTVCLTDPLTETEEMPFLTEEQELIDTLLTLITFHFERREYIDELQLETRRLEQFAYAASHDLQEPLRMVSSYLQLLEQRNADALDEDGMEFLSFARDGADRMRNMIDGLLAYSRIKTHGDPFESVNLEVVLEGVLSDLEGDITATDADITVEALPTIQGDPQQLSHLFYNLLENAIQYSDEPPVVTVSAEQRGPEWVISISDEGIGIDPDLHGRIFEVFERLHSRDKYPGTGIGLAICQRIVERHGGDIGVESTVGEGSTFSVTFPTADEQDS